MNFAIKKQDLIVILTGAGISAESGISTFRENNGLWDTYNVNEVATPKGFKTNPALVWEFYNKRRQQLKNVKPNNAHKAITHLQKHFSNTHIITQNVDNLHEKAKNKNTIHMHGILEGIICTNCNYSRNDLDEILEIPICPICKNYLRPDIVWFGEMPYYLETIEKLLQQAVLFIVIGTSGTVYPAAQFINIAKHFNAKTIFINKEPINNNSIDYFYQGEAGSLLKEVFSEIISMCEN